MMAARRNGCPQEAVVAFAQSHGLRLYVESQGSGLPIVLVHEFAGDYRSWAAQVRALAPDGQAQAVDDIAAVMDHFEIARAHIVGLSMGGYAALNFAIAHPEKARSLVVAGSGHGSDPNSREAFNRTLCDFITEVDRELDA
jgi:pimeloyl-ACP methyl ester carboxylesterase